MDCPDAVQSMKQLEDKGSEQGDDSFDDLPDPDLLQLICSQFWPRSRLFKFLAEYDGVAYLFLLRFNRNISNCVENHLLREMSEAHEKRDSNLRHAAVKKCIQLFLPFLRADREAWLRDDTGTIASDGFAEGKVVNIRLKTNNGVLCRSENSEKLELPMAEPIENPYPNLKLFAKHEVVVLNKI